MPSTLVVDNARQLAVAGQHAELVEYLRARATNELEDSPSLALLYGTAHARLGRHDEGLRWLDLAVDQARKREERAVERDALNARGAVALVTGRIDEAADYFTQALMVASRDADHATTGKCSNNLGIISSLRGRCAGARLPGKSRLPRSAGLVCGRASPSATTIWRSPIGSRARWTAPALATDQAVAEAKRPGDRTLWALTLRGRAQIRGPRRAGVSAGQLDRVGEIRADSATAQRTEDLRSRHRCWRPSQLAAAERSAAR